MDGYWRCCRRPNTASIRLIDGTWHALLNGESLGRYATPVQALDAVVSGQLMADGIALSTFGFPKKLSDWPFYPRTIFDADPAASQSVSAGGLTQELTVTPAILPNRR